MTNLYLHTRKGAVSTLLVGILLAGAQTAIAEGISLNQCANGGIADSVDHSWCHDGWINGNLNKQKAAYAEGDFVPYRVQLSGLTVGETYTYSFSWDTLKSGQHAIDYIGTFDDSVTGARACEDALTPCPVSTTILIPEDPAVTSAIKHPQTLGYFTLFGGTFTSVGDYLDISPNPDVQGISVEFIPTQASVVLAWGGHISSPFDWGEGNTASDIKGSPYHISNIALINQDGVVVASGGKDVQLSAGAVFRPSTIEVTKTANTNGTFEFESMQGAKSIPPDGETNPWTLAMNESKYISAPAEGNVSITETLPLTGPWRLKSIICSELDDGTVFEYDADSDSFTNEATFDVGEGETYSCTFDNEFFGAPVLKVIKKVIAHDDLCTDAVRDSLDNENLSIHSGESVKYCYWVTNTGDDPALDITLSDDLGGYGTSVDIKLSGGSSLGGVETIPDLDVGEDWVSSEMVIAIDVPLNTKVTNIATAEGTGQVDGETYNDTDDANVTTDISSNCTLVASVYTGDGDCPGTPQVNVLAGATVNWCGYAAWDSGAVLDLTGIEVDLLEDPTVSNHDEADMSPAEMRHIAAGSMVVDSDLNGTLKLTGYEGGLNPVSCEGNATVNVVTPGIQLTKTISLDDICGNEDDSNEKTIINDDSVWYCLEVENDGDVPLMEARLVDNKIGVDVLIGYLSTIYDETFKFGPFKPKVGYTNTATVSAFEPTTETTVSESSSATLTVLSADLSVDKSVEPGTIVICGPDRQIDSGFCSTPTEPDSDLYDATYTITVTNNGPYEATGVVVSDTLPEDFIYDDYEPKSVNCDAGYLPVFDCYLGDMNSGASVTITVSGWIDTALDPLELPWVIVENQACANTYPEPDLDPDHSNNCDTAKTKLGTGATRTIGWWSNHPVGLQACLDASGGMINLGFLTIRDEVDEVGDVDDVFVDATVSTDPTAKGKYKSSLMTAGFVDNDDDTLYTADVLAKGMMNASVARWGDGTQRSHIGQARVKAAKQLTAAWCNEIVFDSAFGNFLGGWSDIYEIMAGRAYLEGDTLKDCGGACDRQKYLDEVIQSINLIGKAADLFNNSGDDLEIPFPPGPADPQAPENDPTDPFD